jgi:nucleotide-binding universal stress UspA family protein
MFTRILVPTDFSEPSDAALEYARGLATRFGASLHLVHVVADPVVTAIYGLEAYVPESPNLSTELRVEAELRLSERLTEADRTRLRATSAVLHGPIAPTIVSNAGELAIDLIVMGTHGRIGVAHAIMGSVAERVVRTATCPVLTVHSRPEPVIYPVAVESRELVIA